MINIGHSEVWRQSKGRLGRKTMEMKNEHRSIGEGKKSRIVHGSETQKERVVNGLEMEDGVGGTGWGVLGDGR